MVEGLGTSSSSSLAKSFQDIQNISGDRKILNDDLYSGRWVRRPRRRRVQCQHHKQRALRTWHHICQLCPIQYFSWRWDLLTIHILCAKTKQIKSLVTFWKIISELFIIKLFSHHNHHHIICSILSSSHQTGCYTLDFSPQSLRQVESKIMWIFTISV